MATRVRRPVEAVVRPPGRKAPAEKSGGTPEVALAAQASASSDAWLLRSLVALIGIAMFAFLFALVAEAPRAGVALTGARSRLGSKGLSSSRIELGDTGREPHRRSGGIAYRD